VLAALGTVLAANTAFPQDDAYQGSMGVNVGPGGIDMRFAVPGDARGEARMTAGAHEEVSSTKPGEAFRLVYDAKPGAPLFKVLAPEGLGLRVSDSGREILRDTVPASFDAVAGHFYRVEIFTSDAVLFDRKFEAKAHTVAQLWIEVGRRPPPPPPPPTTIVVQPAPVFVQPPAARTCMDSGDFGSIRSSIAAESFSGEKLQVLESAIGQRDICGSQVIEVLGLFDFSSDKLKALELVKPHIVDPQNNFKIFGAFTFDADKKQAKKILGN